jgi:hypothetical protein
LVDLVTNLPFFSAILSGAFKKYTNNFDFYSNQRTANNARLEQKEKNPSSEYHLSFPSF